MGQITLKSAILIPTGKADEKTPPIPSWRVAGKRFNVPGRWWGLWGNNANRVLGGERLQAQQKGKLMFTAEVILDVGERPSAVVHPETVAEFQYLPLERLSSKLDEVVRRLLGKLHSVKELGDILVESPTLVNDLFSDPKFRHVKAICWQGTKAHPYGLGVVRRAADVSHIYVRGLPGPYRLDGWTKTWSESL